jgi:hypothetical protein
VPATLALTLSSPAIDLGVFQPGVARDYTATVGATVTSTAGSAALIVSDPSGTGRLVNGPFALAKPLEAGVGGAFAPLDTTLVSYPGPVSNDAVTVSLRQSIGAADALRTGRYGKTIVFTLSTTSP